MSEKLVDETLEDEPKKKNIILVLLLGIIIGLAFTAINLGVFFDATLLDPYLTDIYKKQGITVTSQAQFAFTAFKAVNTMFFLVSLIVGGVLSDHIRTRFGNRLPIIFSGLIISGLAYGLAPLIIPFSINLPIIGSIAPLYTGIFVYIFIAIGFAFIWAPSYALLSDLFTKDERATVAMLFAFLSSLGTALGIGLSGFSFEVVMYGIGLVFIIIAFILLLFVPKKNPKYIPESGVVEDIKNAPKYLYELTQGSGDNKGDKSVLFMFLVQICWGVASFLLINNFANFTTALNNPNNDPEPPLPLTLGMDGQDAFLFLGVIGILLAGPIIFMIGKIGKTKSAMIGSLVMGFATFLFAQGAFWNFYGFIVIILLAGGAVVLIQTVTIALPADLVPKGKEGMFMGLFVVAFNFLNPVIAGASLLVIDPNNKITGFTNLFLIITIFEFIAVGLLTFVHYEDVVEEEYNSMRRNFFIMKEKINSYKDRIRRRK
ncbi:MAG: hypothetical protein HeimC3_27640 [Candidatus Heimdallarchaeota archaeon LC_3]|nr:MAG: hypothetical protein HeimC3_27640 [Candidatus Heimdallarchaeota archaeon LC_3]